MKRRENEENLGSDSSPLSQADVADVGFLLSYLDFLSRRGATIAIRRKASLLLALMAFLDSAPAGAGYENTVIAAVRRAVRQARAPGEGNVMDTLFAQGNGSQHAAPSLLTAAINTINRGFQ